MPKLHVRDIDVYYEVAGEGQPLLFIHGLGSSTRDWENQVPVFSQRYQTITLDVRGHGQSDKPPGPYSIAMLAADTADLMRSLELGPAHIVGLSMGGMIAFQLAVDVPEMCQSLVIVNSGPELVLRTFRERFSFWMRSVTVRFMGMRRMGQVLSQRMFPKPEQETLRQLLVERWAENDKRAYLSALRALTGWSVADSLGAITCPTLVIAADQDYTPVSVKEAYVSRMPHAELVVIEDAHHATPMEQPEKFNAVLMEFLSRHS